MSVINIVSEMIAESHERGLVINEIKLDRTSYNTLIDEAVGQATISRPVGEPVKYDGHTLRPCDGCGDLSIKIIAKR